jgi:ribose transport system substrate-binding protein
MISWKASMSAIGLMCLFVIAFGAGCGDDDSGSDDGATPSADSTAAGDDYLAEVSERMDYFRNEEGWKPPPEDSPPPAEGARIYHVNYGLEAPTFAEVARAIEDAGNTLGMDVTVFDGKFDVNRFQEGIRRAIAEKADAIVLYIIDCAVAKKPLEEAQEAGIPVVAVESADCNLSGDGPSLYDESVEWTEGDFADIGRVTGEAHALAAIEATEGQAKVILFHQTDQIITVEEYEGQKSTYEECPDCEIVAEVPLTLQELGPGLQEKAEQVLLQHPEANVVDTPYDDLVLGGIGAAVEASGRSDELFVIGGVGDKAAIELVRQGRSLDAGHGWAVEEEGYQAMDIVNRLLNGEEPAPGNISIGWFDGSDPDSLPPEGQDWDAEFDYAAAYTELWEQAAQ